MFAIDYLDGLTADSIAHHLNSIFAEPLFAPLTTSDKAAEHQAGSSKREGVCSMANEPQDKSFFNNAEYYIIKVVLIITTAIVGVAFLIFALIHVWKFLHAAMS